MPQEKAEATRASMTTKERNAFHAGEKVEFENQLGKVVSFGFSELTVSPGQDAKFTDKPMLALQLPAQTPGGRPEYAFNVDPADVKSLRDDPKRAASLEREFNQLLGDPVPAEPSKDKTPAPEIRQKGAAPKAARTSSTRGVKAANVAEGADARAFETGETTRTNKGGAAEASTAKRSGSKSGAKKAAKK